MDNENKELSKVEEVIAFIILSPFLFVGMFAIAIGFLAVLIAVIPICLVKMLITGGGFIKEYLNYKKQVRKILKDFTGKEKIK
ncbi:hypothetical protein ES708_08011 [subsurface metagenome]